MNSYKLTKEQLKLIEDQIEVITNSGSIELLYQNLITKTPADDTETSDIVDTFYWGHTEEGFDFWKSKYVLLKDITIKPRIPVSILRHFIIESKNLIEKYPEAFL